MSRHTGWRQHHQPRRRRGTQLKRARKHGLRPPAVLWCARDSLIAAAVGMSVITWVYAADGRSHAAAVSANSHVYRHSMIAVSSTQFKPNNKATVLLAANLTALMLCSKHAVSASPRTRTESIWNVWINSNMALK